MSSFGDRVRIRESPETLAVGVAGLEGEVYGFTTPSTTGVQVIGGAPDDYALNVSLTPTDATLWFHPDLLEFLHHNAGAEVVVGNKRLVRQTDGNWIEQPVLGSMPTIESETQLSLFKKLMHAFKSRRKRDA